MTSNTHPVATHLMYTRVRAPRRLHVLWTLVTLITSLLFSAVVYAASAEPRDELIIPAALERHRSSVQEALVEARASVESRLGVDVPQIRLYLSATPDQMRSLASKQQRALPPSWSAGLAFPRDRAVYIPVTAHAELTPLLRHELVHIALADAQIPLWINEGLAVTLGDGLSLERVWTLNEAAAAHRLHSLSELTRRFPEHGHPAKVAYAQAGHFISELAQREGEDALKAWINALISGVSLDEASAQSFKATLGQREQEWRAGLERGPLAWLALTAKSETLWALTILIFVWLGRRKLKLRRAQALEIIDVEPVRPQIITARYPRIRRRPYLTEREELESDLR